MVHFSLDQYLTEENERKKVTVLNKRNYEEMRTHHLKLTQHLTGHQNTTDSFQSPTAVQKENQDSPSHQQQTQGCATQSLIGLKIQQAIMVHEALQKSIF